MRPLWQIAFATCLVILGPATVRAESGQRMLMYTYQQKGIVAHISFIDLPSGPVCHINDARGLPRNARDFAVSKLEFDHIWSALASCGIKQSKKEKGSSSEIEALNSYVFTTAEMPDGEMRIFVVPKDHAPRSVTELVREIRAYNRD